MSFNTDNISDDAQYLVELAERVEVLGLTLVPGQEVTLRGDVVKQIADQVQDVKPV